MISQWGVVGVKNPLAATKAAPMKALIDQQPAKAHALENALGHGLHEQRADGGDEGERARCERAQAEADLQHQRQQERDRADADAEQRAADHADAEGRDLQEARVAAPDEGVRRAWKT